MTKKIDDDAIARLNDIRDTMLGEFVDADSAIQTAHGDIALAFQTAIYSGLDALDNKVSVSHNAKPYGTVKCEILKAHASTMRGVFNGGYQLILIDKYGKDWRADEAGKKAWGRFKTALSEAFGFWGFPKAGGGGRTPKPNYDKLATKLAADYGNDTMETGAIMALVALALEASRGDVVTFSVKEAGKITDKKTTKTKQTK